MDRTIKILQSANGRIRFDENGATMIEYGLITALLGLAVMIGMKNIQMSQDDTFRSVNSVIIDADTVNPDAHSIGGVHGTFTDGRQNHGPDKR